MAAAAMVAGCDSPPSAGKAGQAGQPQTAEARRYDWAATGCADRPAPLPVTMGRSDAELAALLGPSTLIERFPFGRAVGEFRVGLRNHLRMPADAEVIVTERTWLNGECRLTVWSIQRNGTQTAIDSLIWSKGLQF